MLCWENQANNQSQVCSQFKIRLVRTIAPARNGLGIFFGSIPAKATLKSTIIFLYAVTASQKGSIKENSHNPPEMYCLEGSKAEDRSNIIQSSFL